MALNIDDIIDGTQPSEIGGSGKSAPSAAPGGSGNQAPAASSGSQIAQVQQFLVDHRFPISQKDPWTPDGGWGPISNGSLRDFITTYENNPRKDANGKTYADLAKQLRTLWAPQPAETKQNMHKILEVLADKPAEPAAPKIPAEGARPQTQQYQYEFDVEFEGKHLRVPISQETLSSPANFAAMLDFTGMVPNELRGPERVQKLREAGQAVQAALPENYAAARAKVMQLTEGLIQAASKLGQRRSGAQYIRELHGDLLAGQPKAVVDAAVNQLIEVMRAHRMVDFDGMITDESLVRGYNQALRQRLTQIMQNLLNAQRPK